MKTAEYWIERLSLEKHPEGGYYKETYRSDLSLEASLMEEGLEGERAVSTSIYFLLPSGERSVFHRIKSDELWHFYAGSSLSIHMIAEDGEYFVSSLGLDLDAGEEPQRMVKANTWFGAMVDDPDSYTLVGCTVVPGFDFRDFEMANSAELLEAYPQHSDIISKLAL